MPSRIRDPGILTTSAALAALVAVGLAIVSTDAPPAVRAALVLATGVTAIPIVCRHRLAERDWFHPLVFPLGYVGVSLTAPLFYLVVAHRPLEALPGAVSVTLVVLFGLTVGGMAAGIAAGLRIRRLGAATGERPIDHEVLRAIGRLFIVVSTAARAYTFAASLGKPYGAGSVVFGAGLALDNLAAFLVFVGVVLVVTANLRLAGAGTTKVDLALLAPFALLTLGSGGRDELIAPTLFVLWAHHTHRRRIRLGPALATLAAVLLVFQAVEGARAGDPLFQSPRSALARTLVAIGTPSFDASETVREVPARHHFEHGSTYLAALQRQLPGPLAVALFGAPDDTGSFVFRRIIGFNSPNAGFGFSLPSEGYLDFGLPGALAAGLALGLLLGFAYRRQSATPSRATHLLYPVVLATLPVTLRSDALSQLKWVLYPMLLIAVGLRASRPGTMPIRPPSWLRTPAVPGAGTLERARGAAAAVSWTRRPRGREKGPGSLERRAGGRVALAVLLSALLVPVAALLVALDRQRLIDAPVARAALADRTGIALGKDSPAPTRAVSILSTYSGGGAHQSLVLVVCASPRDAARLARGRRDASTLETVAMSRGNVTVFYTREPAAPDRAPAIRSALRGLDRS